MATDEIAEYAAAVQAALEDIPADDRAELLDDLDDHLAEVAAESPVPLTERLGPPEAFAAELRAAYGAGAVRRTRRPGVLWHAAGVRGISVHRRLLERPAYRELVAFLPELRPGWWVVRGFLAAMFVWGLLGWGLMPRNPAELATALLPIWLSVRLGRRIRDRRPAGGWRGLLVVVNVVGGIAMFAFFFSLQGRYEDQGPGSTAVAPVSASVSGDTTNIFPYSKDGTPLHDVLLYDQNGQPLLSNYSQDGEQLIQPCGGPPPLANSYPLPLQADPDGGGFDQGLKPLPNGTGPDGRPTPCSSASPSPSVSPPASPSPSVSPTRAARASGTPSPSHS